MPYLYEDRELITEDEETPPVALTSSNDRHHSKPADLISSFNWA
jgi:hypothetical protein